MFVFASTYLSNNIKVKIYWHCSYLKFWRPKRKCAATHIARYSSSDHLVCLSIWNLWFIDSVFLEFFKTIGTYETLPYSKGIVYTLSHCSFQLLKSYKLDKKPWAVTFDFVYIKKIDWYFTRVVFIARMKKIFQNAYFGSDCVFLLFFSL